MTDLLIQGVLSNLLISSFLAAVAWGIQRTGRSAGVANFFWMLVLVKMVTPPLFTIQLIEVERVAQTKASESSLFAHDSESITFAPETTADHNQLDATAKVVSAGQGIQATQGGKRNEGASSFFWLRILVAGWAIGSTIVLLFSVSRIMRFSRLLSKFSHPPEERLNSIANELADKFKLTRKPIVLQTHAETPPFVWWAGGTPRIVISSAAASTLDLEEMRMVLAHEIAHLKRKDHWVRWLEWVAGIGLWWNPVMWWARKHLRATEEMACDQLVIETTKTSGHQYASALLSMAEILSASAIRPPDVASAITSGGKLEQRLTMIIKSKKTVVSLWTRAILLLVALLLFPLGLVYGQDFDAIEKRLDRAVKAKEISRAQANFMLEALELSMRMKNRSTDDDDSYMEADEREDRDRRTAEMAERKEYYGKVLNEFKEAIERGKMSEAEAEKKLLAIKKKLFGEYEERETEKKYSRYQRERDEDSDELAERKEKFMGFMEKLELAVRRGELSKEDAKKKMEAVKREMFEGFEKDKVYKEYDREKDEYNERNAELEARKRRYDAAVKEIKMAVEKGRLSIRDAESKLSDIQREHFGEQSKRYREREDDDREEERIKREVEKDVAKDLEAREIRLHAFYKEIEAAVKAGKMSKEDARKKLDAVRKEMNEEQRAKEKREYNKRYNEEREEIEERKVKFEAAVREIEQALKAGKISKDDARKKIEGWKRELFNELRDKE